MLCVPTLRLLVLHTAVGALALPPVKPTVLQRAMLSAVKVTLPVGATAIVDGGGEADRRAEGRRRARGLQRGRGRRRLTRPKQARRHASMMPEPQSAVVQSRPVPVGNTRAVRLDLGQHLRGRQRRLGRQQQRRDAGDVRRRHAGALISRIVYAAGYRGPAVECRQHAVAVGAAGCGDLDLQSVVAVRGALTRRPVAATVMTPLQFPGAKSARVRIAVARGDGDDRAGGERSVDRVLHTSMPTADRRRRGSCSCTRAGFGLSGTPGTGSPAAQLIASTMSDV